MIIRHVSIENQWDRQDILQNAKKLILAGAEAGVDYVKFQTFKANKLVSKDAKKADYQKINTKS